MLRTLLKRRAGIATLDRHRLPGRVTRDVFQDMILADGDALDRLGFGDGGSSSSRLTVIVGTILLNICMLQLMIATYGSEYDSLVELS